MLGKQQVNIMVATTLELNPTRQRSLNDQYANVLRHRSGAMSKNEFNSIVNQELKNPNIARLQDSDQKRALLNQYQKEQSFTKHRNIDKQHERTEKVVPIRKSENLHSASAEPLTAKATNKPEPAKHSDVIKAKPVQSSSLLEAAKAHKATLVKSPEATATHQAKDVSSRVNPTVETNITPQMEQYLQIAKDIRKAGGDQNLINKLLQKAEQGLPKQDFNRFREMIIKGQDQLV